MTVVVNGQPRQLAPGTTVAAVVAALRAPSRGVAVAVNGEVVPRAAWSDTTLVDGDQVEVLAATQGG